MTNPPPSLTYAIGDIHGRLDLLRMAMQAIGGHAGATSHTVICLGDYVDRGPDAKGVVETLITLTEGPSWICLKGNHEAMMTLALTTRRWSAVEHWTTNGGDRTLQSYGGEARIPATHLAWLEALPLYRLDAHRLYVHAGVAPGVPVENQDERTLLWIRGAFLAAPAAALPRHVVHGHTPRWRGKPDPARPEILPHRTNLDTGAVFTGVLSVGVFEDGRAGGPVEVLRVVGESGAG
ncbi:MAG: metallophosphoesterase family protein [Caulobacteraceae bacterium]